MSKWIAEFDLEDGDTMPEHMDLNYMGAKLEFHCRPMWIPVSERLPERDVNVLAYVIGAGIKYQRVMWIDDCTGEWVGFIGSGYMDRVVAWMPLPEPYKLDKGVEE